jgi:signal transduction histidine kinase/DNA-binding response OmpR family regulator
MARAVCSPGQAALPQYPALSPAYVNNFSGDNALPEACISDVMTDAKGRIWATTCQGLAGINSMRLLQFDGYNFSPANLANDSFPKPTMAILRQLTPSGALLGFLETEKINAIFQFDPNQQSALTLPFNDEQEGLIKDVALLPDGSMLVLTLRNDGLALYRAAFSGAKTLICSWNSGDHNLSLGFFNYGLVVEGEDAIVMSSNPVGLFRVSLKNGHAEPIAFKNTRFGASRILSPDSFNDAHYNCFATTAEGDLLVLFANESPQVFIRKAASPDFEPYTALPAGYVVHRMEKDAAGNLLFLLNDAQNKYLALLRDRQGRMYDYSAFVAQHAIIHNIRSHDFFKSVFVCAADGLFYKTVGSNEEISLVISNKKGGIRGMLEFAPNRYFITHQGSPSVIYDRAGGQIGEPGPESPLRRAFGSQRCWKFMPDKEGYIWGFRLDTLVRYDPRNGCYQDFCFFHHVMMYERLRDGRIAYTSHEKRGLFLFNPATGTTTMWPNKNRLLGAMQGFTHDIRQTKDGRLWVLTTNGLLQLDLESGKETVYGFQAPFRDSRFVCMAETPDGKLWFGTFLGGIHIFNPADGSVKVVDKGHGLAGNTVVFIVPDGKGNCLAGTYHGLSLLSDKGEVISNFSRPEGLSELEFNRFAALRAGNGDFLLGTVSGLYVVSPAFFQKSSQAGLESVVYLTALTVTNRQTGRPHTIQTGLDQMGELVLPPENRHIRVSFALSNYVQSNRNQFAYMLEGLDKDWTYIGSQHDLTLSNLPAGRYTLLIKGCDFQGNCVAEPVRIPIRAREFFYKQAWFYVLCALPFLAFALLWVRHLRSEKKRLEKEVQRRTWQIQRDKALIEQQARELLQLDEAKSRFFTNISHELRTPITLITAPVEYLIQKFHTGKNTADEERQSLQRVLFNGRKLAELVEELLELSRLEAGKTELLETPTNFYPWFRQLFSAFESQAEMKRIHYELDFRADAEAGFAVDRKRLEKIINNLIGNAIKFTQAKGAVKVSVWEGPTDDPAQTMLYMQVADTGRGIPPEDVPHLFERYFQTKRHDLARSGGTGIGLALAKELALLMKGDLTVESEWERGSAFTLRVPLKKMAVVPPQSVEAEITAVVPPSSPAAPESVDENTQTDRAQLLIVEDNPDMQALLQSLLSADYRLTLANDGQEAWEILENDRKIDFSLILSDVMMPRMDGYALLGKLKSHPQWARKPVILLTARAEQDDKIQALRLGVDDYLVKPFSPPELLARVSNLIANYRSREEFAARTMPEISFEKVEARDELWLKNIETAAKTALDKGLPLQVGDLVEAAAMSERQLFREIKRLTGLTPNQYIQEVRLQKARHLLQHRAYGTLSEVAYAVGFETPSYFTRVFEQHFGKHPSEYLNRTIKSEEGIFH